LISGNEAYNETLDFPVLRRFL